MRKLQCHCGKDGHPLGSRYCPKHGRVRAANGAAWAIGGRARNGFSVRKIVWGRLLARHEKRPGEQIRRAYIDIRPE